MTQHVAHSVWDEKSVKTNRKAVDIASISSLLEPVFLHRISKNVWVEKWPWMVSNSQETQVVFKRHCFSWESNKCVKPYHCVWAIRTESLLFMISSLAFRKSFAGFQKEVVCLQLRATWHTVWLYVHMYGREMLWLRRVSQPSSSERWLWPSLHPKGDVSGSYGRGGKEKKTALSNLDENSLTRRFPVCFRRLCKGQGEKPLWSPRRQDRLGRSFSTW